MTAVAFQGSFSQTTAGSLSPVDLTESLDVGGWHDDVFYPEQLVVPEKGWYLLHGQSNAGSDDQNSTTRWSVNGVGYALNGQSAGSVALAGAGTSESLHVIYMEAGTIVEFEAFASGGATMIGTVAVTRLPTPLLVAVSGDGDSGVLTLELTDGCQNDPLAWWDADEPTKVTVDETAAYMVMSQATTSEQESTAEIRVNGSSAHSTHTVRRFADPVPLGSTTVSIHALTAGDEITFYNDTAINGSVLAVCRIDGVKACMAAQTAPESIPGTGASPVHFDTETVDTDGFHNNVTNNDQVKVPALLGGNYLSFANVKIAYFISVGSILGKNGSGVVGGSRISTIGIGAQGGRQTHGCRLLVDDLSAGDYVQGYTGADGNSTDPLGTFLGMVCIDDFLYETGCDDLAAYQRVFGWRATIDDNALETIEMLVSPQTGL